MDDFTFFVSSVGLVFAAFFALITLATAAAMSVVVNITSGFRSTFLSSLLSSFLSIFLYTIVDYVINKYGIHSNLIEELIIFLSIFICMYALIRGPEGQSIYAMKAFISAAILMALYYASSYLLSYL